MTKQVPDQVTYNGQEFILAGLKGMGLFKPIDFGITREMMGVATACYRGYFCKYDCNASDLFLVELSVIQNNHDNLPLIEGISASSENPIFSHYRNLTIPCPLSGGLVIVRNPVALVGHFPSPIAFEEVIELTFEQGHLQNEIDHSAKMIGLRQRVDELRKQNRPDDDLLTLIEKLRSSGHDKLSNEERERLNNYNSKVLHIEEVEWSFVSQYAQQPTI